MDFCWKFNFLYINALFCQQITNIILQEAQKKNTMNTIYSTDEFKRAIFVKINK